MGNKTFSHTRKTLLFPPAPETKLSHIPPSFLPLPTVGGAQTEEEEEEEEEEERGTVNLVAILLRLLESALPGSATGEERKGSHGEKILPQSQGEEEDLHRFFFKVKGSVQNINVSFIWHSF